MSQAVVCIKSLCLVGYPNKTETLAFTQPLTLPEPSPLCGTGSAIPHHLLKSRAEIMLAVIPYPLRDVQDAKLGGVGGWIAF